MNAKWFALPVGLIALGAGLFYWLPPPFKHFSGTIEVDEYYLGAAASGRVVEVAVDEGSRVSQGDVLVKLDRFEQAERDYLRLKALYEKSAVSSQELEYAKLARDDQLIRAPFEGVILDKLCDVGETVAAGARILVLADTRCYWVRIYIPQDLLLRAYTGMPAQVCLDGSREILLGKIGYIAPQSEFTPINVQTPSERATRTFPAKVYLEQLPNKPLYPGMSAELTLPGL